MSWLVERQGEQTGRKRTDKEKRVRVVDSRGRSVATLPKGLRQRSKHI